MRGERFGLSKQYEAFDKISDGRHSVSAVVQWKIMTREEREKLLLKTVVNENFCFLCENQQEKNRKKRLLTYKIDKGFNFNTSL